MDIKHNTLICSNSICFNAGGNAVLFTEAINPGVLAILRSPTGITLCQTNPIFINLLIGLFVLRDDNNTAVSRIGTWMLIGCFLQPSGYNKPDMDAAFHAIGIQRLPD